MYGHISHWSHRDTQDSASLAPSLDTLLSPMHKTSPSNCYLELVVTASVPEVLAAVVNGILELEVDINDDPLWLEAMASPEREY